MNNNICVLFVVFILLCFTVNAEYASIKWWNKNHEYFDGGDVPTVLAVSPQFIYELSEKTVFLAGSMELGNDYFSVILRSTDGGRSWAEVACPVRGSRVDQIQFIDDRIGWARIGWSVEGSGEQVLYKTTDGGKHWRNLGVLPGETPCLSAAFISFSDKKNGLYLIEDCNSPEIYKLYQTNDGGSKWTLLLTVGEPGYGLGEEEYKTKANEAPIVISMRFEEIEEPHLNGTIHVRENWKFNSPWEWKIEWDEPSLSKTILRKRHGTDVWEPRSIIPGYVKYVKGKGYMPSKPEY